MRAVTRNFIAGFSALIMTFACHSTASAQYPVAIQPVAPAVVGYAPVRRGLFGRRIVYRPVVAPVAAVVPVAPVYAPPVTVRYAPAVAPAVAPVTVQYAPAVAPVTTYYRGYAPVVPIRSYRVPVTYGYRYGF